MGSCGAESASTQEDDHVALCWQALLVTVTAQPVTRAVNMSEHQTLEMSGRYRFHSTRPRHRRCRVAQQGRVRKTWMIGNKNKFGPTWGTRWAEAAGEVMGRVGGAAPERRGRTAQVSTF